MDLYIIMLLRMISCSHSSLGIEEQSLPMDTSYYLALFLLLASYSMCASTAPVYNVLWYGATGDGETCDTDAFLEAWNAACSDAGAPTLLVPSGNTFLLTLVTFEGPCQSKIHVQIDGDIVAPNYIWSGEQMDHWIRFSLVDGLIISGSGKIDGRGAVWWPCKNSNNACPPVPNTMGILSCQNLTLSGLSFINSPRMHLAIGWTVGVLVSGLSIKAPGNSPNTDGIHVQQSEHVWIQDSIIATGDDCISIGTDSFDVHVTGIQCGPGHGISVGSLGKDDSIVRVEGIYVSGCHISGTTNGLRIKTWQGGLGYARRIKFDNIRFTAVQNPIIIDQYYCDKPGHSCPNKTAAVHISNVQYSNMMGTTTTPTAAISLSCSQSMPCSNIVINNVLISSAVRDRNVKASCFNAHVKKIGQVLPDVRCLY